MHDQTTPPRTDDGGPLPPPEPTASPVDHDPAAPASRPGAGRTRRIAALAAVAAGVAITAGIAAAAGDDTTTTEAAGAPDAQTDATTTEATSGVLPSLDSDDAAQPRSPGEMADLGAMPDDGAVPDGMPMREAGRGHGPRGESDGQFRGQFGEMPDFDEQGGDAMTALPGQMSQGAAPDASSQGS